MAVVNGDEGYGFQIQCVLKFVWRGRLKFATLPKTATHLKLTCIPAAMSSSQAVMSLVSFIFAALPLLYKHFTATQAEAPALDSEAAISKYQSGSLASHDPRELTGRATLVHRLLYRDAR